MPAMQQTPSPPPRQESNIATRTSYGDKRGCTTTLGESSWDFMVTGFSCKDDTSLSGFGKHNKETRWRVQPGLSGAAVEVCVQVDKSLLHSPEVSVTSSGDVVFPRHGARKAKLLEDFSYNWPFRGVLAGLGAAGVYEVKLLWFGSSEDRWYFATIVRQREDGLFEVYAHVPDASTSERIVNLPAVRAEDLRQRRTGKALDLRSGQLVLKVPKSNPLQAVLSVEGADVATEHLVWPFAPARRGGAPAQNVALRVSKDRRRVSANVGHNTLSHFLSGEVRATSTEVQKQRRSWTVQVGPLAEHIIVLERKACHSKALALSIDGLAFVEASAHDLGCDGSAWQCNFSFVGERVVDFEVFETNRDGAPLESKALVAQRKRYAHLCSVRVAPEGDLNTSTLTWDGVLFYDLPQVVHAHAEQDLDMEYEALNLVYGLVAPFHVDEKAPLGLPSFLGGGGASSGLFSMCCTPPVISTESQVIVAESQVIS